MMEINQDSSAILKKWTHYLKHEANQVEWAQNTILSGLPTQCHIGAHNPRRDGITTSRAVVTLAPPVITQYAANLGFDLQGAVVANTHTLLLNQGETQIVNLPMDINGEPLPQPPYPA